MTLIRDSKHAHYNLKNYLFLLFCMFEIAISFSIFGYFDFGTIATSFLPVLVLIGGYEFGISGGIICGLIFGISSMFQANVSVLSSSNILFSPYTSSAPLRSIVLCLLPRILLGITAAIVYSFYKKQSHSKWLLLVVSGVILYLHAAYLYLIMMVLFPSFMNGSLLVELLFMNYKVPLELIIQESILLLYLRIRSSNKVRAAYEQAQAGYRTLNHNLFNDRNLLLSVLLFTVMLLGISIQFSRSLTTIFVNNQIVLNDVSSSLLYQITAQMIIAQLGLVIVIEGMLVVGYCYLAHVRKISQVDAMTALYNRGYFTSQVNDALRLQSDEKGWFLMFDINRFKKINDTFGHTIGDDVIIDFAQILQNLFHSYGFIGRIGGDEFAVYIRENLTENQVDELLRNLQSRLRKIRLPEKDWVVSCSVGKFSITDASSFDEVYKSADVLLYEDKVRSHLESSI